MISSIYQHICFLLQKTILILLCEKQQKSLAETAVIKDIFSLIMATYFSMGINFEVNWNKTENLAGLLHWMHFQFIQGILHDGQPWSELEHIYICEMP